jgi:hypothetical protein
MNREYESNEGLLYCQRDDSAKTSSWGEGIGVERRLWDTIEAGRGF